MVPKSSILVGFSILNPPFLGYPYFWKHPYPMFLLILRRLVGAFDVTNIAMEPYMEGALPFVTRFPRKTCDPLAPIVAERRGGKRLFSVEVWESVRWTQKQVINWNYPPPSNSHHQDYYIFTRGSL